MFETTIINKTPEREAFDAKWYERLEKIAAFQAYEYLDGDKENREKERDAFLSGEKENPSLDYPRLRKDQLSVTESELLKLKSDILEQEHNSVVKQIYRWKINEKLAEIRLLQTAESGDMVRFRRYSEFIYGKPSQEIFAYTVNNIRAKAEKCLGSQESSLSLAASDLLASLPDQEPSTPYSLPDNEAVFEAKNKTGAEFSDLLALPTSEEILDAESIKDIFSAALEQIKAEGWAVEISTSSKTSISVNQEEKKVIIPESRKLSAEKLRQLMVHEIGTHALRRVNGERTKLRLLGLGLDRYESGEEGIATLREQVLRGDVNDFSGLDGHLTVSLAKGVDGNPRDFRGVFTLLEKYYRFLHLSNGHSPEEAAKKASSGAWNRCVRTFRGTDCKTAGVCFTKDIIYREGSIAMWDVVSKNSPEMTRFNIGKYDPSNVRHIWVLEQLNITDKDLQNLEDKTE